MYIYKTMPDKIKEFRFAAENTLGKLTKWLRILGFDVIYEQDFSAQEFIRLQKGERILLTRKKIHAVEHKNHTILYIESDFPLEQLKQVVSALGLTRSDVPTPEAFSRCIRCNRRLIDVDKREVWGKAPAYIVQTHSVFKKCPDCFRIYWPGTHIAKSVQRIENIWD